MAAVYDLDVELVILAVGAHKDGCKSNEIWPDNQLKYKTASELDVLLQRVKRRGLIDYGRHDGDGKKVWRLTARGKAEHKRIVSRAKKEKAC